MAPPTRKPLYRPFVYRGRQRYKYSVYVRSDRNRCGKKLIHFGHRGYGQYFDKGGHYAASNHRDRRRRANYRRRASRIRNKRGEFTYKNKNTANYWSYHYLW